MSYQTSTRGQFGIVPPLEPAAVENLLSEGLLGHKCPWVFMTEDSEEDTRRSRPHAWTPTARQAPACRLGIPDENQHPCDMEEWLQIISARLGAMGCRLTGAVFWQGEDPFDWGVMQFHDRAAFAADQILRVAPVVYDDRTAAAIVAFAQAAAAVAEARRVVAARFSWVPLASFDDQTG